MIRDVGDDHWLPCTTHLLQLAMKETVQQLLVGTSSTEHTSNECESFDWDELSEKGVYSRMAYCSATNTFETLTVTSRSICAAIGRSHAQTGMFKKYQYTLSVPASIICDVPTIIDYTLEMSEGVLRNKLVLLQIQERGYESPKYGLILYISYGKDFGFMVHIAVVLPPVRTATKELSTDASFIGDVVPTLKPTFDAISHTKVPSKASQPKDFN